MGGWRGFLRMPPHCDSLDGPVVNAARAALREGNLNLLLPFVPAAAEPEARSAFASCTVARAAGGAAAQVADRWFFETAVRLHRAGEGAPFEGLKPAGLGFGPVVPLAEEALRTGQLVPLYKFLSSELHEALHARFEAAQGLRTHDPNDVAKARAYTSAMLGLQVWAHSVHLLLTGAGGGHGEAPRAASHAH